MIINSQSQRQKLFEQLKISVHEKMIKELEKRNKKNPHPNDMESRLGIFIEELEPQVREAVIEINKKGYATDLSGFVNYCCNQMIEGDFLLDTDIVNKLKQINVSVETNPSGYTRIYFTPPQANILKIIKQWKKVVAILPHRKKIADSSMTKKSREFRTRY